MISNGYNQINLRLSCDKIMFLNHQKVPKVQKVRMNGILFIDFNLVACDFLKFDWYKMLNGSTLLQNELVYMYFLRVLLMF